MIPYDVIVGLLTVIELTARSVDYRMLNKVHFNGESEILNYEYWHEDYHTSEYEFPSAESEHIISGVTNDELVLLLRYEEATVGATDEE